MDSYKEEKNFNFMKGSPSDVLDEDFLTENKVTDQVTEESVGASNVTEEEMEDEQVEEEGMEKGVLSLSVYKAYWSAVGVCLAPSVLTALFLMQGNCNISSHSVNTGIFL